MPHIVQFTHPGSEHGPDSLGSKRKSWNTSGHRRKFMLSAGDYVNKKTNSLVKNPGLLFWGEWEPPSHVRELSKQPEKFCPRWLHQPDLPKEIPFGQGSETCLKEKYAAKGSCRKSGYQNTDPYVFDGAFKYLLCKQGKKLKTGTHKGIQLHRTAMAKLDKGSVILFGSTSGRSSNAFFQLDTVFVVAHCIPYNSTNWNRVLRVPTISKHYNEVVVQHALPATHAHEDFHLYVGASFNSKIDGMYSFTPAKLRAKNLVGFARMKLRQKDLLNGEQVGACRNLLTNNLNSAPLVTMVLDQAAAAKVWRAVRDISRKQDFIEAVRFERPRRNTNNKLIEQT